MSERRGRRQTEEAFLDAQAERQRLRAPEPGPADTAFELPPPSRLVRTARPTGFRSLPGSFWVVSVILITLAITVNAWILLIGLLAYGAIKAFTADSR